jgi:hypothetical protein
LRRGCGLEEGAVRAGGVEDARELIDSGKDRQIAAALFNVERKTFYRGLVN